MATVNVNRKVTDQFYRYKMPKLIAKVEGKGNGIKTVIVNMVEIAKSLSRPPAYPTKYFGCELGAQTQIDKKNDRYIVNGAHDAEKLQEILDSFIERFVLCPECENPETEISVLVKKEKINQRCIACGYNGQISLNHRVTTFILKNPPTDDSATPMKAKKARGKSTDDNSPGHDDSSNPYTDGVSAELNRMESNSSFDDGWSEDTSKEAVQRRMELLTEGVKGLTYNEDLEKTQEKRINIFFNFVKARRTDSNSLSCPEKDIITEAERLDVKDKGILVVAEIFLSTNILVELKKFRNLFLQFLQGNHKAQRCLLGAFEMLIGQSYPEQLLPKVAHILKLAYDLDLLEEEMILQWGAKISKKYVKKEIADKIHAKARPFVDWLKNAEEESSDEDEEVEVVYAKSAAPRIIETTPTVAAEDDIDIDAI